MSSLYWADLSFPPINLYSAPKAIEPCKHTAWMFLPSERRKMCYDCGIYESLIDNLSLLKMGQVTAKQLNEPMGLIFEEQTNDYV